MNIIYIPSKWSGFPKKSDGKVGHFNTVGSSVFHSCAIVLLKISFI